MFRVVRAFVNVCALTVYLSYVPPGMPLKRWISRPETYPAYTQADFPEDYTSRRFIPWRSPTGSQCNCSYPRRSLLATAICYQSICGHTHRQSVGRQLAKEGQARFRSSPDLHFCHYRLHSSSSASDASQLWASFFERSTRCRSVRQDGKSLLPIPLS